MSITAPSFDNAPEWANFVAMDGNGDWYWWENEPVWNIGWEEWRGPGRKQYCHYHTPASLTLTARPQKDSHQ